MASELNRRPDGADANVDAAVVGTGPAGLVTALGLAYVGARIALIGPAPQARTARDARTAALLMSSVDLLRRLGVWDELRPEAAPLEAIRIIDNSGSLVRAPEVEFKASELGLPAFGYNIPNDTLTHALYTVARDKVALLVPQDAMEVGHGKGGATVTCRDGSRVSAALLVGADGRNSLCRKAAGIDTRQWTYPQGAIATSFAHSLPHENVSTELHQPSGTLTTVPLADRRASSLIWVGPTAEIDAAMALEDGGFAAALEQRLEGVVGDVTSIGARGRFPVGGLHAHTLAARRTVLIGEAGHVLPPIGAQGLNLGFRDAAALADCVAEALRRGNDLGGAEPLHAYERSRSLDVMSRSVGIDLLNRSTLTSFLPVQAARGIALAGLKALPPLRRLVMRIGMTPPSDLPRLMRPGTRG